MSESVTPRKHHRISDSESDSGMDGSLEDANPLEGLIDGNSEIKIIVAESNPTSPRVSCDGQVNIGVQPGDVLYIRKKSRKLKLIHPEGHSFYETCRDKLGWGTHFIDD